MSLAEQHVHEFATNARICDELGCIKMIHAYDDFYNIQVDISYGTYISSLQHSSPLMIACNNCMVNVVKALVDKKVNLNLQNKFGETALYIACDLLINTSQMKIQLENIIKCLIDAGADVNICNNSKYTPLMRLAIRNNIPLVLKILEHKGDVNLQNRHGNTAIAIAIYNRHEDIAIMMIKSKCDIELVNETKNTPIMLAFEYGMTKLAAQLIDSGCVLNGLQLTKINADSIDDYVIHKLIDRDFDVSAISTIPRFNTYIHNRYKTAIVDTINDTTSIIGTSFKTTYAIQLVDVICSYI
ncbi:MAG: hypothetical protein Faunusvirus33_8 [Faunusvirus sp.]|jgi:ankyrin repeat protein|uniref:Uncharacterized protein n=1 Tax=Faunusvirus sp. TaxID=2487766 RepID=A0A3G4ZZC6_9VIRU|nr:MAG: hypothetical protein Faunusvirus33_8 [Faunusvirus sp.]